MSNWDLVKESRVNIMKKIYKEYKTEGTLDSIIYNDWCVLANCKQSKFATAVDKRCISNKCTCIDCWKVFLGLLDKEAKRSNMEVYDNE